MKDKVDYKMMHEDAMASLEAVEQIMGNLRRLADFAGAHLSEEEKGEDSKEGDDDDDDKEMKKKLAVIKLKRMK